MRVIVKPTLKAEDRKRVEEAQREGIDRLVVGALIIRRVNGRPELLCLVRSSSDFMGGIEELPSGKVEPGEELTEAVIREVEEETGLHVSEVLSQVFSFDYVSRSGKDTRQFNYDVLVQDGEVEIDPAEHSSYRWLDIGELSESRITENVTELLRKHLGV